MARPRWAGKLAEAEMPLRRAAEVLTDDAEVFRDSVILHLPPEFALIGDDSIGNAIEIV